MKNFKKITLGLLLSSQVLTTFYACSSDSSANVGEGKASNNNLLRRTDLSVILSKDK